MADERPKFEDPAHLLATPDPEAQAAVAARIRQAMDTGRRHPAGYDGKPVYIERDGRKVLDLDATDPDAKKRMEERRYRVTVPQVAELFGVTEPTARKRIRHPEEIEGLDADLLADELGVTIDWLRYGGENGYGLWEDADVVALLYGRLDSEDKKLVCDLIKRIIGPEVIAEIQSARWEARMQRSLENHPETVAEFNAAVRKTMESLAAGWQSFAAGWQGIGAQFDKAAFTLNERYSGIAHAATAILEKQAERIAPLTDYANEVVAAHDVLIERGMDPAEVDEMPADEMLRLANRGGSVEQ